MNALDFASLGSSAFSIVVRKRQALVDVRKRLDAALEADPCDRRCTCSNRVAIDALKKEEGAVYADVRAAEDAWDAFCKINRAA